MTDRAIEIVEQLLVHNNSFQPVGKLISKFHIPEWEPLSEAEVEFINSYGFEIKAGQAAGMSIPYEVSIGLTK